MVCQKASGHNCGGGHQPLQVRTASLPLSLQQGQATHEFGITKSAPSRYREMVTLQAENRPGDHVPDIPFRPRRLLGHLSQATYATNVDTI